MFKKADKYYADWREADGVRKRKSFASKREASAHERAMKLNAANPQTTRGKQRQSSRRTSEAVAQAAQITKRLQTHSARLVAISSRASGRRNKL